MSKSTDTQAAIGRSHKKTEDIGGKKNREAELCRAVKTVIQWEVGRSQSQQAESEAKWDMVRWTHEDREQPEQMENQALVADSVHNLLEKFDGEEKQ